MSLTETDLKPIELINIAVLIATIIAIVTGPILAVWISRRGEVARELDRRRREIFAALMKTRKMHMNPDHVAALNLVQLEFHDFPQVITTYKSYIKNLYQPPPQNPAELESFFRERNDLLFDLVHEIANALNFKLDKRDLERLSYAPQGWYNDEQEARTLRQMFLELLQGRRPIPIAPFQAPPPNSPYPPPPP